MPIALIVGGGMAGRAAAVTLRRVGYQGEIVLVGDETMRLVDGDFTFVDRGDLSLRGRQATVRVGQLTIDGG